MYVNDPVGQFFSDAAQSWGGYVVTLNVIAAVSMGLLEILKNLFPIRRHFQRWQLISWFFKAACRAQKSFKKDASADKAEHQLLSLAANDNLKAFYDQQPEDIANIYNATIQIVLESPHRYADLLRVTASRANRRDVSRIENIPSPMTQEYVEARSRVLHQCQRAIAAFDVAANFRWKWIMQIVALFLSTVVTAIALSNKATKVSPSFISVLITSLLAGFLSPVAKDLLGIIQKLKGD
jgi:hypothetical protein